MAFIWGDLAVNQVNHIPYRLSILPIEPVDPNTFPRHIYERHPRLFVKSAAKSKTCPSI